MYTVTIVYLNGNSETYKIKKLDDVVSCDNGHIMIYIDDDVVIVGGGSFCSIEVINHDDENAI